MKLAKPSHISLISRYILEFSQINSNWVNLFLFSKRETGQNSIIIVRFPYCPQYLKYWKERYSINYTYTLLTTIYFMKANMGLKKYSTEFAVLELIDRITQSLANGQTPVNIYLDLSKAFDTLDHSILLYKLSHYGVNDSALNF